MPRWGSRSTGRQGGVVVRELGLVPRRRAVLLLGGGGEDAVVGWVGVDILALERVMITGHVTGGHGR